MTRTLILAGANIKVDVAMIARLTGFEVKQNAYVEGDDIIMLYECPKSPDHPEVDAVITIGLCAEHDPIDATMIIDENGDYMQELIDVLAEQYASGAEAVEFSSE